MNSFAKAKTERAASLNRGGSVSRKTSLSMVRKTKGQGSVTASPLRPLAQHGASYSYVMPVPPSLNSIYKNVAFTTKKGRKTSRRSKTDAYEDWCLEADWELARQKPVRFDKRVDVSIVIAEIPNADIDNRAKPILDSLKRCGVIKNDNSKYVRQVCARWSQEETACRVNVYHAPEAA